VARVYVGGYVRRRVQASGFMRLGPRCLPVQVWSQVGRNLLHARIRYRNYESSLSGVGVRRLHEVSVWRQLQAPRVITGQPKNAGKKYKLRWIGNCRLSLRSCFCGFRWTTDILATAFGGAAADRGRRRHDAMAVSKRIFGHGVWPVEWFIVRC